MEHQDFTEDDLDKIAGEITDWEHIEHLYEPEELTHEDEETNEEIAVEDFPPEVNEVLSRTERLKLKARFARSETKREAKLKMALRTHSSNKQLNKRARRLAEKKLKEKLARKTVDKLSLSDKERVEKIIQSRPNLVSRLAIKLLPRIKDIEKSRLAKRYQGAK
jgi:hypothetical protein